MNANVQAFIDDLEVVYRKHGLVVGSCGCCSSPWPCRVGERKAYDSIDEAIQHLRDEFYMAEDDA